MPKTLFSTLAIAGLLAANVPIGLAAYATVHSSASSNTSEDANTLENNVAERRFIRTFLRVGALNPNTYDNETVQTAAFDFNAYTNHPCFSIKGTQEREDCTKQFGVLADLRANLENGALARVLAAHELAYDAAELTALSASVRTQVLGEEHAGTVGAHAHSRVTLSAGQTNLWSECGRASNKSLAVQRACFQEATRHLRR